ncbi:MAG: hypothetical protein ACE15B_07505 [Bryobacteraceae bacterium]
MQGSRREFLEASAIWGAGALGLHGQGPRRVLIETTPQSSFRRRLAERELLRGLDRLRVPFEVRLAGRDARPAAADLLVTLRAEPDRFKNPEAYSIASQRGRLSFTAAGEQALLYAVFDFLERQGAFFGTDGESYPLEPAADLVLPPAGNPWQAAPRFATRGLLPWPDFLNCITVFNEEDFRAYFEAMLRMRFNTFGMHVYGQANQWAESYLSFEFAGVGHLGYLDNSASHRWGYLPQRTSRYGMGAAQFYDGEVFGSDATRLSRDPWETAERTRKLLRAGLAHAERLGIRTGVGFEPYQLPDEILRALPPEVKPAQAEAKKSDAGPRFDVESVTARRLLETRLGQLLEAYPNIDYVWLWEDETGSSAMRAATAPPMPPAAFLQAHDFLRRHAPKKRLVVSGWGGVSRNFERFHRILPQDVIFSCLSGWLGWEPIREVFGKLEDRERWPVPWLEDDPAMWLPQFHVNRFERDVRRAAQFGCQGLLGIHWRHRIVDPNAGYLARSSWDGKLTAADYYASYARTQAAPARAAELGRILNDADRGGKLLATSSGPDNDGRIAIHAFAADYSEAFLFWTKAVPPPAIVRSQQEVAAALRGLLEASGSPTERERLDYLTGHVEFLAPYAEAWTLAQRLHLVLGAAAKLKAVGKTAEAREKVNTEGLPLWFRLAPEVRRAILRFQSIVATRSDLGTLASMHNKFVRLALVRLRLSIEEFLGGPAPGAEKLFAETTQPDQTAPARLIVPTRPTLLAGGESVRVMAIVTGAEPVRAVNLHVRRRGRGSWTATPAKLLGRRTYQALLGPYGADAAAAEYYFSAQTGHRTLVSPPEAPRDAYVLTLA